MRTHTEGETARRILGERVREFLYVIPLFLLPLTIKNVLSTFLGIDLIRQPVGEITQDTYSVLHRLVRVCALHAEQEAKEEGMNE